MTVNADGSPDYSDTRPLAEMMFGAEDPDPVRRREITLEIRRALERVGIQVADDIDKFGCTGLFAAGLPLELVQQIRKHWAGAGHGFPCYVSPDRFCLVHHTIGGLQSGQAPQYPDVVPAISRELTSQERFKVNLVENAMRQESRRDTRDVLAGRADFINVGDSDHDDAEEDDDDDAPEPLSGGEAFCSEHGELLYSCSYCLASALVHGPLLPKLLIAGVHGSTETTASQLVPIAPGEVADKIKELDAEGVHAIGIWVQVVRYERKLVRG